MGRVIAQPFHLEPYMHRVASTERRARRNVLSELERAAANRIQYTPPSTIERAAELLWEHGREEGALRLLDHPDYQENRGLCIAAEAVRAGSRDSFYVTAAVHAYARGLVPKDTFSPGLIRALDAAADEELLLTETLLADHNEARRIWGLASGHQTLEQWEAANERMLERLVHREMHRLEHGVVEPYWDIIETGLANGFVSAEQLFAAHSRYDRIVDEDNKQVASVLLMLAYMSQAQ